MLKFIYLKLNQITSKPNHQSSIKIIKIKENSGHFKLFKKNNFYVKKFLENQNKLKKFRQHIPSFDLGKREILGPANDSSNWAKFKLWFEVCSVCPNWLANKPLESSNIICLTLDKIYWCGYLFGLLVWLAKDWILEIFCA